MSKTLRMILSLLRKQPVSVSTITTFLESDNAASLIGISGFVSSLSSYKEEFLNKELCDYLIKIVELTINEQKEKSQDLLSSLIVTNSFNHFQEVVTSKHDDFVKQSIITEYAGMSSQEDLEFYALLPPTPHSSITIGELNFRITPESEFSYKTPSGVKTGCYKFRVVVTDIFDPLNVKNSIDKFVRDTFYKVIGMSFLKSKYVVETFHSTEVIMAIDTYPFFKELAEKYNTYYSNIRLKSDFRLSDISGVELCYFDENGPIIVPRLFYLSSIYTDGDIGTRPFIYNTDMAQPHVALNQNQYRLSLSYSKQLKEREIMDSVSFFIEKMKEFGVGINLKDHVFRHNINEGVTENSINLLISNYDRFTQDNGDYQSQNAGKLACEAKVSIGLRKMAQLGLIGCTNYYSRGRLDQHGTESYSFVPDSSGMKALYTFGGHFPPKVSIYFNRSSFRMYQGQDDTASILASRIIERNNLKATKTDLMMQALDESEQNIQYDSKMWPNVPSNFIPTSFIPIKISQRDKSTNSTKFTIGLSFIPFGFSKFVSTDSNIASADSGFSLYSSDIQLVRCNVRKVLKLSSNPEEIPNIKQVVVESRDSPLSLKDQPLKSIQLDDTHWLLLFKSVSEVEFDETVVWSYASSYVQNLTETDDEIMSATKTLKFTLVQVDGLIRVSKASMMRYFLEVMTFQHEFITHLRELTYDLSKPVLLSDIFGAFVEQRLFVQHIPHRFFELIHEASLTGTINDNIINWIIETIGISSSEFILSVDVVRNFIRSIQRPVKSVDYPVFTSEMQSAISKSLSDEFSKIVEKIYSVTDSFIGLSAEEINTIVSTHDGLLKFSLDMVVDLIKTDEDISNVKNTVIKTVKDLCSTPILPEFVGLSITYPMVYLSAEVLPVEFYKKFVKSIYSELNTNDYTDLIVSLCQSKFQSVQVFNVVSYSTYEYTVTFVSSLTETVSSLDNTFVDQLAMNVVVGDTNESLNEFDQLIYDPNIHCMFSVTYNSSESLKKLIKMSISSGSIYYTQIGDVHTLSSISSVSLCGIPRRVDDRLTVNFFLPFNHSNGRLTVEKTYWTFDSAEFELVNSTVEVDVIATFENQTLNSLRSLIYNKILDISTDNLNSIRSVILGVDPIQKPYILDDRTSHYFLTEDVRSDLKSGRYTREFGDISTDIWNNVPSEQISIFIYPVSPILCKYHFYQVVELSKTNLKNVCKTFGLPKTASIEVFNNFIENYETIFALNDFAQVQSNDEVMIIRNSNGIYTQQIANRTVEAKMSSSDTTFYKEIDKIDMTGIDELTNLDRMILQNKVNEENKKVKKDNFSHKLSLTLSTVRWNTMTVNNYKFYSDDKPKWMKFSNDSYFMAIGFQSGVKIYIRSGFQYVFCNNLSHESVKDIIFGNSQFCITVQYEDSSRPFGNLWITATGNKIPIPINFYIPTTGDAVNIKYIAGGVAKDKSNVFLTIDADDKLKYQSNTVQSAIPIFDHNVFFFSPSDRYLIINSDRYRFTNDDTDVLIKKGTFVCYDLKTFKPVRFVNLNGVSIDVATSLPKCIESGSWVDDNTFIGVTYSSSDISIKMRVTINFSQQSITQVPLLAEYPLTSLSQSMYTTHVSGVHPLYSFLIEERRKYIDFHSGTPTTMDGLWIYNTYISLKIKSDSMYMLFTSTDGYYDSVLLPTFSEEETKDKLKFLINLLSLYSFTISTSSSDTYLTKVSNGYSTLFDRRTAEKSSAVFLQYMKGNYFTFVGDSIYTWKYVVKDNTLSTELTQVDSNGYAKFVFEGHVIFLITDDSVNVALIKDNFLSNIEPINVGSSVGFDTKAIDVAKTVESVEETHKTSFLVYTEESIEKYDQEVETKIIVDSKPISSALCVNRFEKFKLKAHSDSNSTEANVISHDNLLITIIDNVVKIVPKVIQSSEQGLNFDWYNANNQDNKAYWESKLKTLDSYLEDVYRFIPSLNPNKEKTGINFTYLLDIFKIRTATNIEGGYVMMREAKFSEEVIDACRFIFDIFGNTVYIISTDSIKTEFENFWNNMFPNTNKISVYLSKIAPERHEHFYNKMIKVISVVHGQSFISWNVGRAFNQLATQEFRTDNMRGNSLSEVKTRKSREEVRLFFSKQLTTETDKSNLEAINIILMILDIPLPNIRIVQIKSYSDFSNKMFDIKAEYKKINDMIFTTNKYSDFRCMEKSDLVDLYEEFTDKFLVYNQKLVQSQTHTDYIMSLFYKPEILTEVPVGVVLNSEGKFEDEESNYFDMLNGSILKLSNEYFKFVNLRAIVFEMIRFMGEYLSNEKCKSIFKKDFNLLSVVKILGRRDLISVLKIAGKPDVLKEDSVFTFLVNDFNLQFNSRLIDDYSIEDIKLVKTRIGDDIETMIGFNKKFANLQEFLSYIESLYETRFPTSVYELYEEDKIPSIFFDVLDTYREKIPDDSSLNLLLVNAFYIDKKLKLYSTNLKNGYYVSDGTYSDVYTDIQSKMVPLLWKYRNGISDDRKVPVTAIKIVFPRPVKYKRSSDYTLSELGDIHFEYEMSEKDIKHNEKYGLVSINLVDIITNLHERNTSDFTGGVTNYLESISESVRRNVMTEENSTKLIRKLFPPISSTFSRPSEYKICYMSQYSLSRLTRTDVDVKEYDLCIEMFSKMSHFSLVEVDLNYKFDYKYAAIDLGVEKVRFSYEAKKTKVTIEKVITDKKNICCGTLRPFFFTPKIVRDKKGEIVIFSHPNTGEKFIMYYGNTIIDKVNTGFIVTQNIVDRSMTTYLYTSTYKKMNKVITRPSYFVSLVYDRENDIIKFVEKVEEEKGERTERGFSYVKHEVPRENEMHILTILTKFVVVPSITADKFAESVVTSNIIKTRGNITIIASNYKAGSHYGVSIDSFVNVDDKLTQTKTYNFYGMNLFDFDFNDKSLLLIGRTASIDGYTIRVGMVDIKTMTSIEDIKPTFVTSFDREISFDNNFVTDLSNVVCNIGKFESCHLGTTVYVTYRSGSFTYLLMFNHHNIHEVKLSAKVSSVKVSKENGYVALYSEDENRTRIFMCNGTFYDNVEGEVNWM